MVWKMPGTMLRRCSFLVLPPLALAALVGGFPLLTPLTAQESERILAYDVQLRVEPSGSLLVAERIHYDFGSAERHGIFRDIPVRFRYDDRYDRVYPIEVLDVKGSIGTPDQYEEEREGDLLRIRIGDPDRTITGRHTYGISYRVEGALNGFPNHDELYWNAIGTEWDVPVEQATALVTIPGSITEVACFAGPAGSTLPCAKNEAEGTVASFGHSGLAPFEGLTVVVGLPKGVVPAPRPILDERWSFFRAFSVTPLTVGASAAFLVLVAIVLGRLLWLTGRDRRAVGSPVDIAYGTPRSGEQPVPLFEEGVYPVEFAPPDGIRPGQVGVLVDEVANPVDITATIIDLGVRGYLRIEEIPKRWIFGKPDWRLVQLREADNELLPYERSLLEGLFGDLDLGAEESTDEGLEDVAETTPLSPAGSGALAEARDPEKGQIATVKLSSLRRRFHDRFSRIQRSLYADASQRGWFTAPPDRVRKTWAGRGWFAAYTGAALTALAAWRTHLGLIPIPIVLGGLALAWGARWMPRRTAKGTGLVRRVLGFRTYIATAEAHMARWAEQENVFSRYLPFAIVFGLTERWARAFAQLGKLPPTAWYVGSTPFSHQSFASSVDNFALSSAGTLGSPPAASGSSGLGGGGASGGGGGGGGGGSW
jgi:hypothetical protein